MAGGELLAGECRPGATVLGFQIGLHREVEEGEGSQAPSKTQPVGAACKETDGGAMVGPVDALGKVASGRCLAR